MSEKLGMMSRLFDWNKNKEHKECCICMVDFEVSDMVTPLPCDKRHYFHSECIEQWSKSHNDCPLCKAPFDAENLEQSLRSRSTVAGVDDPEAAFFTDKK